jgi:hypothetical protein
VANPINILAKWLSLHDERTTTLPSLVLRQCRRIISEERAEMAKAPFSLEAIKTH